MSNANHSLLPPIGHVVPPLQGLDPSGQPVAVTYGPEQRTTILFAFSEHCEYCSLTWPAWDRIAAHADKARMRLVFVSLIPGLTAAFTEVHHLNGAIVVRSLAPQSWVAYNLLATPEIVAIAPNGTVEKAWVGQLDAKTEAEVLKFIGQ